MPLLLLFVLVAGCDDLTSGHPGPVAPVDTGVSRLPPRPRQIQLDGVDPCRLLTSDQLRLLGVGGGKAATASDGFESPVCQWDRFPQEPQDLYLVQLVTKRGAEYALDSVTGARIVDVAGYSAVETQRQNYSPDKHCVLLVDIAPGQNLWVQYDYGGKTVPMTKQLACEKAHTAAEMAVATLTQQAGGK